MNVIAQAGTLHSIVLDPEGENLGLVLAPGGWQMRQALPFAAKTGSAKPELSFADLTDWSVWEQANWSHGALQEDWGDDGMFLWGNIDSRFANQLILPPRPQYEPIGTGTAFSCGAEEMASQRIQTKVTGQYAQQFECATQTVCSHVYVFVSRQAPNSLVVALHTDTGGEPGTLVRTATIEPTADPQWAHVEWASSYTLLASTKYWIVMYIPSGDNIYPYVMIGYDPDSGYGDGLAKTSADSGSSWSAFSGDFFFIIEDGWQGSDLVTGPFAIFKADEYVVAGAAVYVHDDANSDWDGAGAGLTATGTDLVVFNGVMYAAQDAGNAVRKTSDGASWSDMGGAGSAAEGRCFCVHGGMLYRSRANLCYYSSDPQAATPSWSSAVTVGTTEYKILKMVSTQWGVIALKADGGWLIPGRPGQEDRAYRIDALNWATKPLDSLGVMSIPAVVWSDGMLYIAERGGLLRWDGEVATPVGLDLGTGLPSPYSGSITGLLRHTNFLYLTVGAGADDGDNLSSFWAYNGGWHKLADAWSKGKNIAALGYTTQHSPHRILLGVYKSVGLIKMPDTTDNPAQYASPIYAPTGNIVSSAFSAGLPNANKVFLDIGVHAERATSTQTVRVYYRIDCDNEDAWWWLGDITDDGLNEFSLPEADFAKRQIFAGSTRAVISLGSTSGVTEGDWVCINQGYGQVKSIITDTSITLYYPLPAAPAENDWLYPGAPVGKKIWYQLVLTSEDKTKTPVVKGVYVKYRVLLKDKRVWRAVALLRPGDTLLTGQPSSLTVSDVRAALWRLARRAQFNCRTPDYRSSAETLSVIISDYSEFLIESRAIDGGGRPEASYQVTLSLLEV